MLPRGPKLPRGENALRHRSCHRDPVSSRCRGTPLSAGLRARLLRGGAGIGGLSAVELALGLATAVLLARELGVAGLGAYSLGLAVAVLAGLAVEWGLPGLVTREIAHAGESGAAGTARAVLGFAVSVILGASAVVLPLALVFGGLAVPGLGAAPGLLPLALALVPVTALTNALGGALAGRQRVVAGNLPRMLVRPGVFALCLAGAMVLAPGWLTPTRAMALQLAACIVALGVALLLLRRDVAGPGAARAGPVPWRSWGAATLRLGLINGLRLAEPQVLLLLAGVLASVESAGLLRVAQRGATLGAIGVSIAVIVAAPEFARLDGTGQRDRLQGLLTRVTRFGAAASAAGCLLLLGAGGWILGTIFGPEFAPAWAALLLLSAAEVVRAAFGPAAVLLSMLRREGATAAGSCLSAAVSAAAGAALLPSLGATGAAIGGFLGLALSSALLWWRARRILGLESSVLGTRARGGGSAAGSSPAG